MPPARSLTPVAPAAPTFYRVQKTCRVPRGASTYTLTAGKVISSRGYDIEELKRLGVPLEPTTESRTPARAVIVE